MSDDDMIKGVKLAERRGELIVNLLYLSDVEYQMRKWVNPKCDSQGRHNSFSNEIDFTFDFFDDLNLLGDDLDEIKRDQYDAIGWYLKSDKEVEIICAVAEVLRLLCHNCYTNEEYLSSPHLALLRERSAKAFHIFMENEKDNEKFCQWLYEYIGKLNEEFGRPGWRP
ncbi:SCO4402 family protein [Candidatus Lariskella endosymbiont of Hedychridium roseum]|uniref:SCO4402 family protein n=1 Tax=Candidatus Lariskella endosymbiont of Hedychridium roseum TaxID=3077949 RepID=UPI0030CE3FC3